MMKRICYFFIGLGLLVFANPEFAEVFAQLDNGGFESGVQANGAGC